MKRVLFLFLFLVVCFGSGVFGAIEFDADGKWETSFDCDENSQINDAIWPNCDDMVSGGDWTFYHMELIDGVSNNWVQSGGAPNEWYYSGVINGGSLREIFIDDVRQTNNQITYTGVLGALTPGLAAWGDNDLLGYDTWYVYQTVDPDLQAPGYIYMYNFRSDYVVGDYVSSITSEANNPIGLGGRGFRTPDGPGLTIDTGPLEIDFPSPQKELWIRWYQKHEEGYNWEPLSSGTFPFQDKHVYLFTGVAHNAAIAGYWNREYAIQAQKSSFGWPVATSGDQGWPAIMDVPITGGDSDGEYHCFEVHVKMDTDGTDGIGQIWIDGVLKASNVAVDWSGNVNTVEEIEGAQEGWTFFKFGSNQGITGNPESVKVVDHDDLIVYNATPPNVDSLGNPFIGPLVCLDDVEITTACVCGGEVYGNGTCVDGVWGEEVLEPEITYVSVLVINSSSQDILVTGLNFGDKNEFRHYDYFDDFVFPMIYTDSFVGLLPLSGNVNWFAQTADGDELRSEYGHSLNTLEISNNASMYSTSSGFRHLVGYTNITTYGVWEQSIRFSVDPVITDEMWVRFYMKYGDDDYPWPSDFTEDGSSKIGYFWYNHNEGVGNRQFIPTINNPSGTVTYMLMNQVDGDAYWARNYGDDALLADFPGVNKWIEVKMHFKLNTFTGGVSNEDGIYEFYIDGEKLFDLENSPTENDIISVEQNALFDLIEIGANHAAGTGDFLEEGEEVYRYYEDVAVDVVDPGSVALVYISNQSVWDGGPSDKFNGDEGFVRQIVGSTSDDSKLGYNSWNDSSFVFKANVGDFESGTYYLYVVNWDGVVNEDGFEVEVSGSEEVVPEEYDVDLNGNGFVDFAELVAVIVRYKDGLYSFAELVDFVNKWKDGEVV